MMDLTILLKLYEDWDKLIQNAINGKLEPHAFRTRLDALLLHSEKLAVIFDLYSITHKVQLIKNNMSFMRDNSNQNSDGVLEVFNILHGELDTIKNLVKLEYDTMVKGE